MQLNFYAFPRFSARSVGVAFALAGLIRSCEVADGVLLCLKENHPSLIAINVVLRAYKMAVFAAFVSVVGSLFLTPFLMFLLCIIFLASIGKSLGVRRLYVKVLLMIFEVSFCFAV